MGNRIVIPVVVGSSPIGHPRIYAGFGNFSETRFVVAGLAWGSGFFSASTMCVTNKLASRET